MAWRKLKAKINLETLADGAFTQKLNEALLQVAENIQNTNTEATARRSITVTLKFDPDKDRELIRTTIAVQTKLAAAESIDTKMVMGVDEDGEIELREYDGQVAGQMRLDDFESKQIPFITQSVQQG